MERNEATEALALLRRVVDRARDDSALQNWGVIWILHAFTNGIGFVVTDVLLWNGVAARAAYAGMWAGILAVNFLTIFLFRRRAGARSFVERMIFSIWTTFVAAIVLLAILNEMLGLPIGFLAPVVAVFAAVGFSMMAAVLHPLWFVPAAAFAGASVVMALFPGWQFVLLGVLWFACQLAAGLVLERIKRRRLAAGDTPRLV